VPGWWFDVIKLFGLAPDDVVIIRSPTVVESLDFPIPGSMVGFDVEPWYIEYLERLSPGLTTEVPDRLYFGRTHLTRRGNLMGESYYARQLERSGFVSVQPERYPVATQMAMVKQAETIVFAEGSSVYSVCLVGRTSTKFFMIPRRQHGQRLFVHHIRPRAFYHSLGDDKALVRLSDQEGRSVASSPSYTLDGESIHDDMVRHGLVSGRFDANIFLEDEREDAISYWGSMPRAEEQLGVIADLRKEYDAGR
jgi:hypothetical protein